MIVLCILVAGILLVEFLGYLNNVDSKKRSSDQFYESLELQKQFLEINKKNLRNSELVELKNQSRLDKQQELLEEQHKHLLQQIDEGKIAIKG